ncbi:hypothetical protein F4561_002702 [Lipingzhangella halophila]|uniref:Uncharacterized protein n=1 Tax=Lipingzhangella halophila TaxID=1783352 RepID=A0A7W7RHB2_9ACTN|nr:hypothetical protein [Lipingzhangella halophila]MBB4931882.1 hypothetical protein [Lipingzhangella halophila]
MKLLRTIRALFRRRPVGGDILLWHAPEPIDPTLSSPPRGPIRMSPGYFDMSPAARKAIGEDAIAEMNKMSRQQRRRMW